MWNERESPLRIEKRFEFDQYSKISKFMGEIEKLCKERDLSLIHISSPRDKTVSRMPSSA